MIISYLLIQSDIDKYYFINLVEYIFLGISMLNSYSRYLATIRDQQTILKIFLYILINSTKLLFRLINVKYMMSFSIKINK